MDCTELAEDKKMGTLLNIVMVLQGLSNTSECLEQLRSYEFLKRRTLLLWS